MESARHDIWTSIPARVITFDPALGTVDVQPVAQIPVPTADGWEYRDPPAIPKVLVCFPGGGIFDLTFPLSQGDVGMLHFSTFDTSHWDIEGIPGLEPENVSRHAYQSCYWVPRLKPMAEPRSPAEAFERQAAAILGISGGTQIQVKELEILLNRMAVDYVALASKVDGVIAAMRTYINAHTHTAPGGGGTTSSPITPLGAQPTTAAATVKAL
jgi:hypothetical protein